MARRIGAVGRATDGSDVRMYFDSMASLVVCAVEAEGESSAGEIKLDALLHQYADKINAKVPTSRKINGYDLTADRNLTAADVGAANPNLLHNSDFRAPVNQRGQSTYHLEPGYTIDRWYRTGSGATGLSVSIEQTGMRLTYHGASTSWYQPLEFSERLAGTTVTVSLRYRCSAGGHFDINIGANGASRAFSSNIPNSLQWTTHSFTFTLPKTLSALYIGLQARGSAMGDGGVGSYIEPERIKLEIGSSSTLANDPPPDYGVELLKCQRFFVNATPNGVTTLGGYTTNNAKDYITTVPLPVVMRTTPTIVSTPKFIVRMPSSGYSAYTGSAYTAADVSTDVYRMNANLLMLRFRIASPVDPNNIPIAIGVTDLILDANL